MYKVAEVARFASGIDHATARERWCVAHAALGAAIPGVGRYVQNFATASLGLIDIHDSRPAFDGYACACFPDRSTFRASMESPEWSLMQVDASSLFVADASQSMAAAVEEHVIIDGPIGPFKAVWFVQFTKEIRADANLTHEAHQYWTRTHGGAFGVRVPGIDRYVQNHVVEPIGPGAELGFDGFSECWFKDRAAFDVTMGSSEWDEMNADAKNIFDREWIVGGWSALVDELVVREG